MAAKMLLDEGNENGAYACLAAEMADENRARRTKLSRPCPVIRERSSPRPRAGFRFGCASPSGAGLGKAMEAMHAWLDESCGADAWTTAPAGRGVGNDAMAFY
jgi:hypothetical protein